MPPRPALTRHLSAHIPARAGRALSTYAPDLPQGDTQTLSLPDRTLSFAIWGTGPALLYLHGYPSSRLEGASLVPFAAKHGISIICPDRPGFGQSTPQPARRITDWPSDVARLLDHLGLDRVAMLGGSGGGPYALACAVSMPERLKGVGLLAAAPAWTLGTQDMPFVSRVGKLWAEQSPGSFARLVDGVVGVGRWAMHTGVGAKRLDAMLGNGGSEEDRAAVRKEVERSLFEGFRQGGAESAREAALLSSDWGFNLEDVKVPVTMWHGTHDARAPIRIMRDMAKLMPHATLVEMESGHFDVPCLEEVVAAMAKMAKA